MRHAFKEWAVICRALAEGKQSLVLRKGGIAETAGDFQVEHTRFWLFPTYVHQQKEGIRPEALPLFEQAEAERPMPGHVRISHFAEITGIYHVHDLLPAMLLAHLHLWSDDTVKKRFDYRSPGIYVLPVRVYRAAEFYDLPDTVEYQGCRSWVELDRDLSTEGAVPVLPESAIRDLHQQLDLLLKPSALA
jgi:hypothetical protein